MIKYGTYCKFNTKTGVKTFKTKVAASTSYRNQYVCYLSELAPPVYEWIDDYTYRSGIADTSYFERKYKKTTYLYGEYKDLYVKLRKILPGRETYDIHSGNLGIYDGKVVLIDFYP